MHTPRSAICLITMVWLLQFQESLTSHLPLPSHFAVLEENCRHQALQYLTNCCPVFEYTGLQCIGQPVSVSDDIVSSCRTLLSFEDISSAVTTRVFTNIINTCSGHARVYLDTCCNFLSPYIQCV